MPEQSKAELIRIELDRIWESMVNDPARAFKDSVAAEKESVNAVYNQGIRDSKLYQGWCLIYMSRIKEAIEILTDLSGSFSADEASEDNIRVLNALGVAYNDLGDNNNAFYYYSKGLKLSRTGGFLERELSVLNNIGSFFLDNGNYEKALSHFRELLEKAENNNYSQEIRSVVLINTGVCYYNLGQYDEAERFLQQSRIITAKLKNRVNDSEALYELARVKFKQNDKEAARSYINESLELCKEIDNRKMECELLVMQCDLEQDISYCRKACELSYEINFKQNYQQCCRKLAEFYEGKGNFRKALEYLKEHYKAEKEINNSAAERKFQNLEMEFELERNRKNAEFFKTENLELKESLNWMTLLNKIARDTISTLETDTIFSRVFHNINLLLDVTHFHVVLYNREKDILEVVKAFDNGNEIPPFTFTADESSSYAGWAIKNHRDLLLSDIEKEYEKYVKKRAVYGDGPLAKSSLTVPIFMRNNEIGAVAILSNHKNAYKEEHVHFLKSLAAFLAIAIDNSRHFEEVKELNSIILAEKEELKAANRKITELATHDILTGLINRRVLFEILEAAMEQSKRRGEILAVLFIDLDDFKMINDTWGHNRGDKVLKEIAARLKDSVRATDSVARIGGDEFLILLNPVLNKNEARKVAEKIISAIGKPISFENTSVSMSMSIGISIFPDEDITAEQMVINADYAMYNIKKGQKNGICFFESESAERR